MMTAKCGFGMVRLGGFTLALELMLLVSLIVQAWTATGWPRRPQADALTSALAHAR